MKSLKAKLTGKEFSYVVPDFRLNKDFENLEGLTQTQKSKVEFLCNECCWFGCKDRKNCYEAVSRKNLGENKRSIYVSHLPLKRGIAFQKQ